MIEINCKQQHTGASTDAVTLDNILAITVMELQQGLVGVKFFKL